jgi:hypothetical protein
VLLLQVLLRHEELMSRASTPGRLGTRFDCPAPIDRRALHGRRAANQALTDTLPELDSEDVLSVVVRELL